MTLSLHLGRPVPSCMRRSSPAAHAPRCSSMHTEHAAPVQRPQLSQLALGVRDQCVARSTEPHMHLKWCQQSWPAVTASSLSLRTWLFLSSRQTGVQYCTVDAESICTSGGVRTSSLGSWYAEHLVGPSKRGGSSAVDYEWPLSAERGRGRGGGPARVRQGGRPAQPACPPGRAQALWRLRSSSTATLLMRLTLSPAQTRTPPPQVAPGRSLHTQSCRRWWCCSLSEGARVPSARSNV